ncbi:DUF3301 domain-containing protein [Thioalkalivibrio sp. ALJT]|uniref:DUF3301 domain-containing protein n=1 Tax=Thioalkalivibrio sp. ALJT TaxID=1158146 RepID=UPI00037A5D27|nr:DUF3301 domain-containing protein [Thioalkalivibrio sp. ALJT]
MTGLMIILSLALVAFYVNDTWRANERARRVGRQACERAGVQLLDATVVRIGQRPVWGARGFALQRRYRFEFSADGAGRHPGEISLEGQQLKRVTLDWPDGGREFQGPDPDDRRGGPAG